MPRRLLLVTVGVLIIGAVLITRNLSRPPGPQYNKLVAGCRINLRLLDDAKRTWAMLNHKTTKNPAPTLDDLRPFCGTGPMGLPPECPAGGVYTPGRLDEPAKCSLGPEQHTYERAEACDAAKSARHHPGVSSNN
jgi:hypothetical protein